MNKIDKIGHEMDQKKWILIVLLSVGLFVSMISSDIEYLIFIGILCICICLFWIADAIYYTFSNLRINIIREGNSDENSSDNSGKA